MNDVVGFELVDVTRGRDGANFERRRELRDIVSEFRLKGWRASSLRARTEPFTYADRSASVPLVFEDVGPDAPQVAVTRCSANATWAVVVGAASATLVNAAVEGPSVLSSMTVNSSQQRPDE